MAIKEKDKNTMKNYRIQKENSLIENANNCFYIEAKNIEDIKEYLKKEKLLFIRYSEFSETVYIKG